MSLVPFCDFCGQENIAPLLNQQGSIVFKGFESDVGIALTNLHPDCGKRIETTIYRLREKARKEASEV